MSGSPPSAPTGVPTPRPEDPADAATSDKRVLVIAMVVMLLLVTVGVVSGALFNRSACATIDPDPVAAGVAGGAGSVDEVLAAAFDDTGEQTRDAVVGALEAMAERFGPVTGVAEVTGATGLSATDRGVAALGPVTTLLDPQGSEVLARVDVGDGEVVGGGDALFSVAAANELTGQVDAVIPLDPDLEAQTCTNTSLINSPLAFALDASDGELLLLRIDEDGGEPELELRDADQGRVWGSPLDIGLAQPGLQGERLTGRLGPGSVVTGFRTAPGDDVPVMSGVDRATGSVTWNLQRDDLRGLLAADVVQVVTVWATGDDRAIVSLSPEPASEPSPEPDPDDPGATPTGTPTLLIALDPDSGDRLWDVALGTGVRVRHVGFDGDAAWVTSTDDDEVAFERFGPEGERTQRTGTDGTDGRTAVLDDGRVATVSTEGLGLIEEDGVAAVSSDLQARDVVTHDGSVTVLLDGADGGTIAVTFAT